MRLPSSCLMLELKVHRQAAEKGRWVWCGDSKNSRTSARLHAPLQWWTRIQASSYCLHPGWCEHPTGEAGALHHGAKHTPAQDWETLGEDQGGRSWAWYTMVLSGEISNNVSRATKIPAPPFQAWKAEWVLLFHPPNHMQKCLLAHLDWDHTKTKILGNTVQSSKSTHSKAPTVYNSVPRLPNGVTVVWPFGQCLPQTACLSTRRCWRIKCILNFWGNNRNSTRSLF